jgi:hypothetical protein
MALFSFFFLAFRCQRAEVSTPPVWQRPNGQAAQADRRLAARSARSHAASQRRGQASHPPRVRCRRRHSQLRRACAPPRNQGRTRDRPPVVAAMGRQRCLPGGAAAHGQTTLAEQSGGQPSRARSHPRRQSRASRHSLHGAAASRASGDRQGALSPFAAALRQGRAGREAEKRQEEDSRRM